MFALQGFLNILIPVFQNSNFFLIYLLTHFKDFYFSEFLLLKVFKKTPEKKNTPDIAFKNFERFHAIESEIELSQEFWENGIAEPPIEL